VTALVLGAVYCLYRKKLILGSFLFGLSVHFKIYPIIYSISFLFFLNHDYFSKKETLIYPGDRIQRAISQIKDFFNVYRWKLFIVSASVFFALLGIFDYLYGYLFLYETYLYHLVRRDDRHNFSLYFYHLYLAFEPTTSKIIGLLAFVPQMGLVVIFAYLFSSDLPFCIFLQTYIFVIFNKVCTAQYFLWYISLYPLLIPSTKMKFKWEGLSWILAWIATEVYWLYWGYQLEYATQDNWDFGGVGGTTFDVSYIHTNIWIACTLFFPRECSYCNPYYPVSDFLSFLLSW